MPQIITLNSGLSGKQGLSLLRHNIKLSLRAALNSHATYVWLKLLNGDPLFRELVMHKPSLVLKIYRPYLSNTLNCSQRLGLLQAHYRFILSQGLGNLVVRAAERPVLLGEVEGKNGTSYGIELSAIAPLEREGELVLRLVQGQTLIYSVAFSFFREGPQLAMGIGCIQGPQGEDGLQHIRAATHDLHGMRPKNLMLRLLAQLGHNYGCQRLLLVGNANLAHQGAARKGQIFADYNALWEELGARQRPDGDYQLRCEPLSPPDMATIASKKRSEARKRFDTLLALANAVSASLHAAQNPPMRAESVSHH